jgi:hypothetical protein
MLLYECGIDKNIRDTFEGYFKKSKEAKVDLFQFYELIEKCELDVKKSS